ncbi:hypothetical protein SERLA73DRAFT_127060 [Serpula lacrymans var. lacrymans S7.3]|uniref:ERCC4 domain-containing protein n=2 Tax=Serpula lacrymans var. lacrymans TaxID=341189 RepID=F8QFG7_SERL3|nr:uncharacterized protein SERLADRAFT_374385 [Serpula lacrymans var. lacrymans S7.9]EGN92951.1 hypothetical protein SERLA73DRAFT_127060 [Serpula lacrymans var. lacrymans S7.3]EGO19667.1 hypothetical protein SERLADRAFT_374385 [Serpula lacrymans var. lacrymans S7.9]
MTSLLPFHKEILEEIHDPSTSELLILARGLGLRRLLCTLMQIYESPQTLVLLVNASQEEESAIGEELGIMGCRKPGLRLVGYELGKKDRQELYKKGGLISVTSRILVVDMLQSDIPINLITGIIILHAERVTALSLEAFIVRLYREKNSAGFLKAFTDQPEHITSGMSPLKNIMKELQLRTVHIYPRFHETIKSTLESRKADVIELYQRLTEPMEDIHHAIVQCMTTTLSELKRSNTTLDLDDLNIESAYFRSFDMVVRRQLDPVWHKVGPKTKQLVSDLATLRQLLNYLLTYDSLSFHAYLEALVASNTINATGNARQHQSPWMLTDAANVIFQTAKRRCYTVTSAKRKSTAESSNADVLDDADAWDALYEAEGRQPPNAGNNQGKEARKAWLPDGIDPVLEELPKWDLLADILQEIEEEMIRQESLSTTVLGSNTVLIMASSTRSAALIREYLSSMDVSAPKGARGRKMMERKLKSHFWWKGRLATRKQDDGKGRPDISRNHSENRNKGNDSGSGSAEVSEALKRKDKARQDRSANRRRVRGGAPPAIAKHDSDFDTHYGLVPPQQTIIVRAYSDDVDDQVLWEVKPRFIVMFEPSLEFIRRIEVYKNSSPGLGVRVYFMIYQLSCEEHKYLAGLRREKESFERLIKERGSMLLPIFQTQTSGKGENTFIKTISSRFAGGRKELSTTPPQVIVDMREFRSTLPSLLHASSLLIIPATLTVGDYVLTPDICVERKSIPDLVSSFNSGRLYTQCELMSVHYKQPILLIEFEENKSFSLETVSELKSYAKPSSKYPSKKPAGPSDTDRAAPSVQSKLVLLTLHFPRVRIIWSSSPYATTDIFNDLKANNYEPDSARAVAIGAEDDPEAGAGVNAAAEELLRCLPGITAKNVKYVMSKVQSVRELCEMSNEQVQEILGVGPGKACWEFMHKGEKSRSAT